MTSRLLYETSSGNLSATDTFKQLIENLRLVEEDASLLSNACKGRSDQHSAAAWKAVADNFSRVVKVVEILALYRANPSSIGYASNFKKKE